jgi:hypothetical protein
MVDDEFGAVGGMKIGTRNRNTQRKPAPSAPLSSRDPSLPDLDSNSGHCGGKLATALPVALPLLAGLGCHRCLGLKVKLPRCTRFGSCRRTAPTQCVVLYLTSEANFWVLRTPPPLHMSSASGTRILYEKRTSG